MRKEVDEGVCVREKTELSQYVHMLIKTTQQERKDDTLKKKDNSRSKILK